MTLAACLLPASMLSCAPLTQPKLHGLTPTDAEAVAILAVRTAERDRKLELEPFNTRTTPDGNYEVSLQRKTSLTTAEHWRVVVRPDRSAEVIAPAPSPTTPQTLHANPAPLQGDSRDLTPTDPAPVRLLPAD
jgi:hypothetical protein